MRLWETIVSPADLVGGTVAEVQRMDSKARMRLSGTHDDVEAAVAMLTSEQVMEPEDEKEPVGFIWRFLMAGGNGNYAAMLYEMQNTTDATIMTLDIVQQVEQHASTLLKTEAVAVSWVLLPTRARVHAGSADEGSVTVEEGPDLHADIVGWTPRVV